MEVSASVRVEHSSFWDAVLRAREFRVAETCPERVLTSES